MRVDVGVQAKSLPATLHYLKRGPDKPVRYVFDPPPGVPQWNGIDDPHEIRIEDGRGREREFSLDRNGFQLVKAPSQVSDFYSDDEIKRTYYPEVEQLLRDKLGATRVAIFDHTVRNAGRQDAREPSRRVHNSADDGRARLSFHTSFDNPLAPHAPPRESIEVRTLVFFPPDR